MKPQNIRIGVFQGKGAEYNRAVLKILLRRGPSTSWEIARAIQKQRDPIVRSEADIYKSQKIYSVLARKDGVLDRLMQKHYIENEHSKWTLLFPKSVVILIHSPEIASELHPYYTEETKIRLRNHLQSSLKGSTKMIKGPFGLRVYVNPMQFKLGASRLLDNIKIHEMMLVMAKKMNELQKEGIDLDEINPEELAFLVLNRMKDWISSKMVST